MVQNLYQFFCSLFSHLNTPEIFRLLLEYLLVRPLLLLE